MPRHNKGPPACRGPGRRPLNSPPARCEQTPTTHELLDLTCALAAEIAQTASRTAEHASILESIGSRAFDTAGTLSQDASAHELLRKAHEVRGLVAQAFGVLADLEFHAGRMQALAALRQACAEERD